MGRTRSPRSGRASRSGHRSRLLSAACALLAGVGYLTWRIGWTLGTPWWTAVPLLAAETIFFVRFALLVTMAAPEPVGPPAAAPEAASSTTDTSVAARPPIELLVPAGTAGRDDLTRTLTLARRAGLESVRVLDHHDRRTLRREAHRLGATYEVLDIDLTLGSPGLVEAARTDSRAAVIAWVDAGDVVLPGFADLAVAFDEPGRRVAVVQSATDLINSDSLMHLVPDRDDLALENRVTGPSLSRSGAAIWHGSGSLFRADAIADIGGIPIEGGSTRRVGTRLARAGWSVMWSTPPSLRTVAPDTLSEHLWGIGRTAHEDWSTLIGGDSPLRPARIGLRRRMERLYASTAVLDGLARLTLVAVLVATLLDGRLPFDAPLGAFVAAAAVQLCMRSVATLKLGRGTLGFGDMTRMGMRLMGIHVVGLIRPPRVPDDDTRGGFAVLGRLRLLAAALVAVDLALAARGLTFVFPDMLPHFAPGGRILSMAAAVWAIVVMVDVLQLLVGRVQRRSSHRSTVELVATVNGQVCRVVDITPQGIGLLLHEPPTELRSVTIGIDIPRLDGSTTPLLLEAKLRHASSSVDGDSGRFRVGASFRKLDDAARDALIEFCALTAEQRDLGRGDTETVTPEDLVVSGGGRRAFAAANLVAVALAGLLVAAGPAGAAPLGGGSSIKGRVLGPDGSPHANVCLSTATGPTYASTMTGADGTFSLEGLSAGTYAVLARDCMGGDLFDTFSGSTIWSADATTYTLDGTGAASTGTASTGDVTMHATGTVNATVQGPQGEAMPLVCANFVVAGPDNRDRPWIMVGSTDAEGRLTGRVPSDLDGRVVYSDCSGSGRVANTWYPSGTNRSTASTVRVGAGAVEDLGITTMTAGAPVSGRITDSSGVAQRNVCVSAYVVRDWNWDWLGGGVTDADGRYSFIVAQGTYSVWVSDCGSGSDLVSQWYPQGGSNTSPPPTVDVTSSGVTLDVAMARGGHASGTLLDEHGRPALGACVALHDISKPLSAGNVSWDRVGNDGTWSTAAVPPGTYAIEYTDCDGGNTWARELRPDVHIDSGRRWSIGDLTPVTIEVGRTTTGVDDTILHLAHIGGVVREAGRPVAGVCIGGITGPGDGRRSAEDGTWSAGVIPDTDVTLTFSDCEPGRGLRQEQRQAHLAPGEDRRVDVDMTRGATSDLTGSVRNAAGTAPSTPSCVVAYRPDNLIAVQPVAPDGTFVLSGVADGDYWFAVIGCAEDNPEIRFAGDPTVYPPMWFPAAPVILDDGAPDPGAQGAVLYQLRSSRVLDPIQVCFGDGCPQATTTVPGETVPATSAPATPTVPSATTPVRAPVPAPAAFAGGKPGGSSTVRRSPQTPRSMQQVAPAMTQRKKDAAAGTGTSATTTTAVTPPAAVSGASALAPVPATGSAVTPGVFNELGEPVARRELLPTVPPEHQGFAWDLLAGTVLVAGAAIALILVWRRRHPGFG